MKVCDHLNLLEKDYYGLTIWDTPTMKVTPISALPIHTPGATQTRRDSFFPENHQTLDTTNLMWSLKHFELYFLFCLNLPL